jgi:hypothetical protein
MRKLEPVNPDLDRDLSPTKGARFTEAQIGVRFSVEPMDGGAFPTPV